MIVFTGFIVGQLLVFAVDWSLASNGGRTPPKLTAVLVCVSIPKRQRRHVFPSCGFEQART